MTRCPDGSDDAILFGTDYARNPFSQRGLQKYYNDARLDSCYCLTQSSAERVWGEKTNESDSARDHERSYGPGHERSGRSHQPQRPGEPGWIQLGHGDCHGPVSCRAPLRRLFFFTWKAFFVACFLWWVSGSLGIGMSYHRLLTHRGYKTPKWVEYFLTWCATLALEGGPIFWVATHRIHHQYSDE